MGQGFRAHFRRSRVHVLRQIRRPIPPIEAREECISRTIGISVFPICHLNRPISEAPPNSDFFLGTKRGKTSSTRPQHQVLLEPSSPPTPEQPWITNPSSSSPPWHQGSELPPRPPPGDRTRASSSPNPPSSASSISSNVTPRPPPRRRRQLTPPLLTPPTLLKTPKRNPPNASLPPLLPLPKTLKRRKTKIHLWYRRRSARLSPLGASDSLLEWWVLPLSLPFCLRLVCCSLPFIV